jgi:hypothetical protein
MFCFSRKGEAENAASTLNLPLTNKQIALYNSKLVHEKDYVAEVDVELIYKDEGWSPYLSVEDAYKLDDVREALRRGDIKAATKLAKVFSLTPVSA